MNISLTLMADFAGTACVQIELNDVIFVEYARSEGGVIIHSLNKCGYLPGKFNHWVCALVNWGLDTLVITDRNYAINLSKIKLIDYKHKIAYFEHPIVRKDKWATMVTTKFDIFVTTKLDPVNRTYKFM